MNGRAPHTVAPRCAFGTPVRASRYTVNMWVKRKSDGAMVAINRDLGPGEIGPTGKRLRAIFPDDGYMVRVELVERAVAFGTGTEPGNGGDAA